MVPDMKLETVYRLQSCDPVSNFTQVRPSVGSCIVWKGIRFIYKDFPLYRSLPRLPEVM
jgi:hypothetical protein